nr:hypothetical protein [Tanacetum cinerariifolium]
MRLLIQSSEIPPFLEFVAGIGLGGPGNQGNKTTSEVEPDSKTLQLIIFVDAQALLLSDDEMVQESDEDDMLKAEEEINEDMLLTDEEAQSPPPNIDKPESSYAQNIDESDSDSSTPEILKKYDNILPLIERQLVKYLRKVSQVLFTKLTKNSWDKHEEVDVSYADLKWSLEDFIHTSFNKYNNNDAAFINFQRLLDLFKTNHNTSMRRILENLKEVQNVVKEDPALNKKVLEATKGYTKNSTDLTELVTLVKSFNFQGLKSSIESLQVTALSQDRHLSLWAKSSISMAWNLGPRMTVLESSVPATLASTAALASIEGENVANTTDDEPLSHIEGEHVTMENDTKKVESNKAEE